MLSDVSSIPRQVTKKKSKTPKKYKKLFFMKFPPNLDTLININILHNIIFNWKSFFFFFLLKVPFESRRMRHLNYELCHPRNFQFSSLPPQKRKTKVFQLIFPLLIVELCSAVNISPRRWCIALQQKPQRHQENHSSRKTSRARFFLFVPYEEIVYFKARTLCAFQLGEMWGRSVMSILQHCEMCQGWNLNLLGYSIKDF